MAGVSLNRFAALAYGILQVRKASRRIVCRPISKSATGTYFGVVFLFVILGAFGRRVFGIPPFVCRIEAITAMRTAIGAAGKFKVLNICVVLSVFTVMICIAAAIYRRFTAADLNCSGISFVLGHRLFGYSLIRLLCLFTGSFAFFGGIVLNLRLQKSVAVIINLFCFVNTVCFGALRFTYQWMYTNKVDSG